MSETDAAMLNWSDLGVSELVPTGTVTLLLADVEGSTPLWETQPHEMTAAFANLDRVLAEIVPSHGGVRPIEQGEGDSFVVAFGRASDAIACALELQRAPLAPIRLRIGLHTGEVQLRDESNYIGPTINRTARIRDLAHGGQTVLSGTTTDLVCDRLPEDAWLAELGTHAVRDLPKPERIVQLCHPDIRNEFPPLRTAKNTRSHNLPAQLTTFVGRAGQVEEVRQLVVDNRLVTLTGAGGAGKTRLAVEVAAQISDEFVDGVWWVDLAAIADPLVVSLTIARTLGLPDQLGRTPLETVQRFIGDRGVLLLLDNCEHLLDACGDVITRLLNSCPGLTILATSREPISVSGEVTWRVPSLSVHDEAVALFTDRAQRARPTFHTVGEDTELVADICRRLDGMPLAIELAAARVRALSLRQIADSLHDRFRLLTGGARNTMRRQQTLRASVDWSHALLTEAEQVLFRRLGVFMDGFDFDAARAVAATSETEQFQILDQLSLLVDKSLVVADEESGTMRYRLLETIRQYALEKLAESGEASQMRTRHRDYYVVAAAALENKDLVKWAERETGNLLAAHAWSTDCAEFEPALRLISSLQRLWETRGRMGEGIAAFDLVFNDERYRDEDVATAVWTRAVADRSILTAWISDPASLERAEEALAAAREVGDSALIASCLAACGALAYYSPDVSKAYFTDAIEMARALGDRAKECYFLSCLAVTMNVAGQPLASAEAAEQGLAVAEAIGDGFVARHCRVWLGVAWGWRGGVAAADAVIRDVSAEAHAAGERMLELFALICENNWFAFQSKLSAAWAKAREARATSAAMGGLHDDTMHIVEALTALAAGDGDAAKAACEAAMRITVPQRTLYTRALTPMTLALLACGELSAARRWVDENVAAMPGNYRLNALVARAHVALAQGETDQAARDAHDALALAVTTGAFFRVPEALEALGASASAEGNHRHAARLFGAADAIRMSMGPVFRWPVFALAYDPAVTASREVLGDGEFGGAWAEGAALSIEEAIAYAQRGRGERKRAASGWESLTPTEADVVRLVAEGLGNKEIADRLFISPRTVQTHLTHVYAKLALTSRIHLVQEAARHV
ncbi:LuxR family transcriptional regulator [Mycolicibacterium moriokaense]|uniref:LuxR family transcriptional regulator n=1 Tax=Mycolicibacterium moriokaense TaxID=39691 RepID=A0AAD1M5V6_9MYCO|nr:LuxR family transcriptional regulator [Mycolicibacterium moriokaense]MCV7041058.1 LuxR family transcriptional regulator [Mycolicibacterium moriokaense]ORB27320.1 LuxR family transcriptional regulator [Mycolicibacterium moriokaense]BBX00619.1 LuxR family transcriptional regulator [Mycolicibacterium moriokaense]